MNALVPHLSALQVVGPLFAAPVCILLGRGALAWAFATLVSWAALAISAALLWQVWTHGPASYALGSWAPPIGIEYRIDMANALMLLIVSAVAAVVLPYARDSVRREIPADKEHLFYCMFLLCLTGLLGMTVTGDAFNVFVFLEISSLSTYALIAMGRDRRALTAAYRYLVLGAIGATFFVIGVGLIYMMTGTLNMADMAERIGPVAGARPVLAAFAFITVGLALKFALFPLHLWLPNAYTHAPTAMAPFLAATATKVAIYVLLRFTYTVFGGAFAFERLPLGWVLFVPGLAAIFAGAVLAIFQTDGRRMLAYSSISQIGYIALAISLTTAAGVAAGMLHIFNHALAKATLFCALGSIYHQTGSMRIGQLSGIAREMPFTMAAFVVGGFSLIGFPLTAGFLSKWYLLQAVLELRQWWLAALILLSSLLALVYIWRVIEVAYFRDAPASRKPVGEAPPLMLGATLLFAAANLYFGVETSLSVGGAFAAAAALLGTTP
jgi:multicomponent Na+:H+ antiporter subunit D